VKYLELALAFGNHKGATNNPDLLEELVKKDVIHGYGIVLPLNKMTKIPGVVMAPMNISLQSTIDEESNIILKDRLTHDQSFCFKEGSNTSVNSHVKEEELDPCMFGSCIRRINGIVELRRRYANRRIPLVKIDIKSEFRKMHLNADMAIQTCTHIPHPNLGILSTRLTFGGSPINPSKWEMVLELLVDLANAIQQDPNWNPDEFFSPSQPLVPAYEPLLPDIPFAPAKELFFKVLIDEKGKCDDYIDDLIGYAVDLLEDLRDSSESENVKTHRAILLCILFIMARPGDPNEPIPREVMEALNKLAAEAGPTETKVILGWLFDTRCLRISLPENKAIAWTKDIDEMLELGKASAKRLEKNIGRYIHITTIIPMMLHHFLNRLRCLE
jgi:hypothetical protein